MNNQTPLAPEAHRSPALALAPCSSAGMTLEQFKSATPEAQADYLTRKLGLDAGYRDKAIRVMQWAKEQDVQQTNDEAMPDGGNAAK